jgi:hypothetical protein
VENSFASHGGICLPPIKTTPPNFYNRQPNLMPSFYIILNTIEISKKLFVFDNDIGN